MGGRERNIKTMLKRWTGESFPSPSLRNSDSFSPTSAGPPRERQQFSSLPTLEFLSLALSKWPRATLRAQASKRGCLTALPKATAERSLTHALQMLQRSRRRLRTAGRVRGRRRRHHPPSPSQTARAVTMTTGGGWLARASRDPPDAAVPKPPRKKNDRGGLKECSLSFVYLFLFPSLHLEPKNCNMLGNGGPVCNTGDLLINIMKEKGDFLSQ